MKYIIYAIVNTVTKKFYIGSTDIKYRTVRFNNHFSQLNCNSHHSFKLQKAFLKYGKSAFESFIIEEKNGSLEERNDRESFWINIFNSYKKGYNCTEKGSSRKKTDEEKEHLSLIVKEAFALNKRTTSNKKGERRDTVLMNRINRDKRLVISQYTLSGEFIKDWEGIITATQNLNISKTSLGNCLKKRSKSAGGFQWKYKHESLSIEQIERKNDIRVVLQFSKEKTFIKEWESCSEAARAFKAYPSGIIESCKNQGRYKCKGYYWKYKEKNEKYVL